MKKVLSIMAISAFVMTTGVAFAGGPGKRMMMDDGCPEKCQNQIDELNGSQNQQNETLSAHAKEIEMLKNREALYSPWYIRAGAKAVWPHQYDIGMYDIDADMGWGFQVAAGKKIAMSDGSFRLEFEYGHQKADIKDTSGDVILQTYMVNGYYEMPLAEIFSLYATVGAGYGKYDINVPFLNGAYVNNSEGVFAYKAGTGMTFNFTEQMALDLGYEYLGTSHAVIYGQEINKPYSHNVVTSLRFMF